MKNVGLTNYLFRFKSFLFYPSARKFVGELEAAQKGSADYLYELNRLRRRELVRFAYENTSFYREKYSAVGFELGDLESEGYFEKLPVLEKQEIRVSSEHMIPSGVSVSSLKESTTGGSTGEPLKVFHDPASPVNMISWRVLNWWGVRPSDNSGYIYRAVPVGKALVAQALALWPTRRAWLSAAQMGPQQLAQFLRTLQRHKVKYIVGYVGAIEAFATYLEAGGHRLDGLRAVWTTASPLPEGKRLFMEKVFGCPVYTQYGSCEIHWLAAECSNKRGMHMLSDVRHLEFLEQDKLVAAGAYGDIVVTDLLNMKFPMIRYRIGDRGRLLEGGCSCGRPFPLMDYVKGRVSDSISTKENGIIPGEFWTTIFDDFTSYVKSFRVHQHADYSISVYYEFRRESTSQDAIDIVRSRLEKIVGASMEVKMIEKKLSGHDDGKTRFVTSELSR